MQCLITHLQARILLYTTQISCDPLEHTKPDSRRSQALDLFIMATYKGAD
ncbi:MULTISPECIES: hypothetical protein [unclassified Carboxylicivirga]